MNESHSVEFLPTAERALNDLIEAARDDMNEDALREAMNRALSSIRHDAKACGEPLYDLKQMKMKICRIIVPPLYVEFGVHFDLPSAFIRRVVLLR